MKSLAEQLQSYAVYHRDPRNKTTHFFGVPLVVFSLFVGLGWFRFVHARDVPITGATVFYLAVFIYYLCLDWSIALLQAPLTLALLWLADIVSRMPIRDSILVFLATFVVGWLLQLLGHFYEGKRPALMDNFLQIFNAPLFLTAEALFLLGMRQKLRDAAGRQTPPP